MPASLICPTCGAPVAESAAAGLCRRCLLLRLAEGLPPRKTELDERPIVLGYFGDYELLDEIARGGMGVVYKARLRTLSRIVALKMVQAGRLANEGELKRFRNETEAVSRLDHPNIVPIYEVGAYENRAYFTMKWIDGVNLAEKIGHLSPEKVTAILAKVAWAVHYAHQRGILHRDLKPANILLDAQDEPHITDFGLAKQIESAGDLTQSGAVIGTPNYMAPEQAAGRNKEITTSSDVFSLGAILYELLAGEAPFCRETPLATMRAVVEQEVIPPNQLLRARSKGGQPGCSPINKDLETICLKSLQKEPSSRYPSAEALAQDLERWLRHEPIRARPSSIWEQGIKWGKRHPAPAGLLLLALLAPTVVAVVLLVMGGKLTRERNSVIKHQETAFAAAERAEAARAETRQNLYAADMLLAQHALDEGNLGFARRLIMDWRPQPNLEGPALIDLRGFEWRYLWSQVQGGQMRILRGHTNAVNCVAFSPDGKKVISSGADRVFRIWETTTGNLLTTWHWVSPVTQRLSFSKDGWYLATGDNNGLARVWEFASRKVVWSFKGQTPVRALFSPLGPFIAVYERGPANTSSVNIFNYKTKQLVRSWPEIGSLEGISGDGKLMATSNPRSLGVDLWDVTTGEHRRNVPDLNPFFLALSHDGEKLAACKWGGKEVQFSHATKPIILLQGHTAPISAMEFSPDGKLLATAGNDQALRVWDLANHRNVTCLRGHESQVNDLAFSPDGKTIATAGRDETVRMWTVDTKTITSNLTKAFPPFVFSSDGRTLAAGTASDSRATNKHVMLFDLAAETSKIILPFGFSRPAFFSPNNRQLATLNRDTNGLLAINMWNVADHTPGETVTLVDSRGRDTSFACSPNKQRIAIGNRENEITLYSPVTGQTMATLAPSPRAKGPATQLAISADERFLAAFHDEWMGEYLLVLWDLQTRTERIRLNLAGSTVSSVEFSPDSQVLAAGMSDDRIHLWRTKDGAEIGTLVGHQGPANSLSFSADGRTLASVTGELKLWSLASRREVATALKGQSSLRFNHFSSDGLSLVTVDWQGVVRVLKAPELGEIDQNTE